MTTPGGSDSDDLPPPMAAPAFVRAKSVEEQKSESGAVVPLVPSFRRQHSFEHTIRPVPVLEEGSPKTYFSDILLGMGFDQSEIDAAIKSSGELSVEELVEVIVAARKKKAEPSSPPSPSKDKDEESKELLSPSKSDFATKEDEKEEKKEEKKKDDEPLSLDLGSEEEPTEWKCRYCSGYVNSSSTEVCIQCNRARALCQELTDDQKALEEEAEAKKKREENEIAEMFKKQQEELERLEQGPWPCRFCDHVNPAEIVDCKGCASMKYLTRVLFTDEEWIVKLRSVEDETKKASEEDRAYREEWEKKKKEGGTVECLICFDDVQVKDMVFADCKHNFCLTCWTGYLETKIKDGEVLKLNCPAPKCRRPVERKEVKARVSSEMFERYNKYYTQAQLSLNPNARWCPTPDCESVMFGSKTNPRMTCPKCTHEICFRCNHDWHTGTCEQAARGLVGLAADRAAFAAWAMMANVKPCPQCRAPIEKNEGCNHMTCQRCHHQWCWMCRGEYNSNHYKWWNLWGCPGGQFAGILTCLGDDRCCCIDLGCGCGLLGKVKRTILKLGMIACGLACCPCIACVGLYQCLFD